MSSFKHNPRVQQAQKLPHGKPLIALDDGLSAGSGATRQSVSSSSTSSSKAPPDNPPPSAATGNGLPSVNVPRGGGAIRGIGEHFSVSPATGTVTASIPLPITPGRAGFQPDLSLSYDSGGGNGPFGFGWQLGGLPSVGRKTDLGLPRYDDEGETDTFVITGAEDLVPELEMRPRGQWCRREPKERCVGGIQYSVYSYRPRIEGSFARIERWVAATSGDTHWRSISRGNQTTTFGEDHRSRVFDPDDPSRVFRWLASCTWDDRGNAMVFEYKADDSAGLDVCAPHEAYRPARHRTATKYLKRIKYGNRISRLVEEIHQDSEWLFELVFDYGDHEAKFPLPKESCTWPARSDPFSSNRSGFEIRTYRLCRRVLMFHHFPNEVNMGVNTLVASLELSYFNNGFEKMSGLSSATCVSAFQRVAYLRKEDSYAQQSLPPVEIEYSEAIISEETSRLSTSALEGLPLGIAGDYQFLDLDGEGVPGILAHQSGSYYYKANLGLGKFGPPVPLPHMPISYTCNSRAAPQPQWLDLLGDGHVDMVCFDGSLSGFYKRAVAGQADATAEPDDWQPFKSFQLLPNVRWRDPNLKFVDLTGDGHADILITADEQVYTVYPSLQEDGFGPPTYWRPPLDENRGPKVVLDDGVHFIYIADMTGDGLSDLVRIDYHEVCYWPNLGYGRFGAKVVMSNAPLFDSQEQFRQSRLRLADIDGSGTTDLVYLKGHKTMVYINQAGNGWTRGHRIASFPGTDDTTNVQVVDLLGKGTGCLVWSSTIGSDLGTQVRYVDLMEAGKPYMMTQTRNNLGSESRYWYTSSAQFYLADKAAGNHWVTKLPFPVHVVERVENYDHVSKNRFATRYAYHSGHYDGIEKEFRGFGMVETWDTEDISTLKGESSESQEWVRSSANWGSSSTLPPVLTKTWFHTGAYFPACTLEAAFSKAYNPIDVGHRLPDSVLPGAIRLSTESYTPHKPTQQELREGFRALKGSVLHSEIYGLDGTPQQSLPYTTNQANFLVEMLQPRSAGNRHAIFHTRGLESIQAGFDRRLYEAGSGRMVADPRVAHSLTTKTDEWGNVLQAVALSYGRQLRDKSPLLAERDHETQARDYAILTENIMTNEVSNDDIWLAPLSAETRSYELFNLPKRRIVSLERLQSVLAELDSGGLDLPYESYSGPSPSDKRPHRRLLQHAQSIYRSDNLTSALPLGVVESLAVPYQNRQLAMSRQQVQEAFVADGKLTQDELDDALHGMAGYINDDDGNWWTRTALMFLSPYRSHTPAEEVTFARQHFFHMYRAEDVFSTPSKPIESLVVFDAYDLLVQEATDPLGNRTTVGERDPNNPTGSLLRPGQDYRLMQPKIVTDPNGNVTELAFDVLGMFAGSAVMGKPGSQREGDSLDGFAAALDEAAVQAYFNAPLDNLPALLGGATSRHIYDYHAFYRTRDSPDPQPVRSSTLSRETHLSVIKGGEQSRIMVDISYSDGFGRVIQHKVQSEPGPVPPLGTIQAAAESDGGESSSLDSSDSEHDNNSEALKHSAESRWIGSGWTVYNNKGALVRQFEPFFSPTHHFQSSAAVGVSPILLYDPLGRVLAAISPDRSWTKVRQDPWRNESWDANDTVLIRNPADDEDVGGYFERLDRKDYFPTWYEARIGGDADAKEAAVRAAAHANTPRTLIVDALGRTFAAFETVRTQFSDSDLQPTTQVWRNDAVLDIQGNQQRVHDSLGRLVGTAIYTYGGGVLKQVGLENGSRWALTDILGKTVLSWDGRGQRLRIVHDELRRPTSSYLSVPGRRTEAMVERTVYGESRPKPEEANARARIVEVRDQAGITSTESYDFKGNMLRTRHRFAKNYRNTIDWAGEVDLEEATFEQSLRYDALNRVTDTTLPDGTVTKTKFSIRGLQESVSSWLRGEKEETKVVLGTTYNARGQRVQSVFGNGTTTVNTYDSFTFRLARIATRLRRQRVHGSHSRHVHKAGKRHGYERKYVQDLRHEYDAVGNLSSIADASQKTVWHDGTRVDASQGFIYDSVYRLVEASGREHLGRGRKGKQGGPSTPGDEKPKGSSGGQSARQDPHPANGRALGRYLERYHYDLASNILRMEHRGVGGVTQTALGRSWTRYYGYNEPSALEDGVKNNRLSWTRIGKRVDWYKYEGLEGANGSMTAMPKVPDMRWNFRDQLAESSAARRYDSTSRAPRPEADYIDVSRELDRPLGEDGDADTDTSSELGSASDSSTEGRPSRRGRESSHGPGGTMITYYRYDYTGKRVRKVSESVGRAESNSGQTRTRLKEAIYVGGAFEIFRKYRLNGGGDMTAGTKEGDETLPPHAQTPGQVRMELQTAQILGTAGGSGNGGLPILRAEFLTVNSPHDGSSSSSRKRGLLGYSSSSSSSSSSSPPVPTPPSSMDESSSTDERLSRLLRFQYSNLQGSSTLELNHLGRTLTREEYTPFGATSFSATGRSAQSASLPPKRFRYAGQERDEGTGLYYMGARYYAAWLGRWTSGDPSGLADGLNSYVYARCNPVAFTDPSGHSATTSAGATLQGAGQYHDRTLKALNRLLHAAGYKGDLEVTVKAGLGGSRLDWLRKAVVGWKRTSIELKTTNMFHYFDVAEDGTNVLNKEKVASAVAVYLSQVNRHSRHLHEFLNTTKELAGVPSKREALIVIARGFKVTSPEFKAFRAALLKELASAANGPVAAAVVNSKNRELKAAKALGALRLPGRLTRDLVNLVKKGEEAAKAARSLASDTKGFVAMEKVMSPLATGTGKLLAGGVGMAKALAPAAKKLGPAGTVLSMGMDVATLADSDATGAQKVEAGVDLAANALMASGFPPAEAASVGLTAGGAVGGWVDHHVEAMVTSAGGSHETAETVGTGAGVLAGAATGALLGAGIGLALGPGGAAVGAAIGGAAGAIGAAIKIHWGS
ncbi:hypothetical protein FOVG_16566 [Fusarium oxysporum f. sp. pisi HDV247]|uniref:Uncharacterized protein n=1 Tax=Fusarium oxysporum f. sp. pisi HDV247 TaxID=1080344 RepID=W9NHL2_FUSOX|nr:hypothetical protein FOVG_16566 [Fusarium oxysporum f. sp. pisi HDV247]